MSWGMLDDRFWRHPKTRALRALGGPGREALGIWVFWWSWCLDEEKRTGVVPESELPAADAKLAPLLVKVGLWDEVEGGFAFHDFWTYNPPPSERKKEADRKRIAEKREAEKQRPGAPVAGMSHATSHATDQRHNTRQVGDSEGDDYGDLSATVERIAPRHLRDVAGDSHARAGIPIPRSQFPDPNSQPPQNAHARDGGGVEFADDQDIYLPPGTRAPAELEAPTVQLVREAYTAAYKLANQNRAPTWTRGNVGALNTLAAWVDERLEGGPAAVFVQRLVDAFFAHEDAKTAMVPIALLASNPAQYLAPRAHQTRRNGKAQSRDGFLPPAAPGAFKGTDLDKVFGEASRVAESK